RKLQIERDAFLQVQAQQRLGDANHGRWEQTGNPCEPPGSGACLRHLWPGTTATRRPRTDQKPHAASGYTTGMTCARYRPSQSACVDATTAACVAHAMTIHRVNGSLDRVHTASAVST